eukprot:3592296-Lingulodinium_polyedra.AAC.1
MPCSACESRALCSCICRRRRATPGAAWAAAAGLLAPGAAGCGPRTVCGRLAAKAAREAQA